MIVKCITMQKDENNTLLPWIKYHGYLFGFENIVVFDNGSTIQSVIDNLLLLESVGGTVIWGYRDSQHFHDKGDIIARFIKNLDESGEEYDFAFPMDADEFLGVCSNGNILANKNSIHSHLERLDRLEGPFRITMDLFNIVNSPGWFWPQPSGKVFVRKDTLKKLDHGFHFCETVLGSTEINTQFIYFHYHHKPYNDFIRGAYNKLAPFVDINDSEALKNFQGPGGHLLGRLTEGESWFNQRLSKALRVYVPDIPHILGMLGLENPLFSCREADQAVPAMAVADSADDEGVVREYKIFDAKKYLANWPHIAADGIDPFRHYVYFGYNEGLAL